MEILVILILASFLFIIAIFVALFVVIRKNIIKKEYERNLDQYLNMIDEEDANDNSYDNVANNIKIDREIDHPSIKLVEKKKKINKPKDVELINILINKKNYMFLANGNKLEKNKRIKLKFKNKSCHGIVTKKNYWKDINSLKIKPSNLILLNEYADKIKKEQIPLDEYVPLKKKNN